MRVTVGELAALVQGKVHGEQQLNVLAARPLLEAGPQDITFVENDRNARHLKASLACAALIPPFLVGQMAELSPLGRPAPTFIEVADPLAAFITIVRRLHGIPDLPPHGIDPRASVDPSASIGPEANIFPFAVIGPGTVLGARCQIHSGVVIGRNCRIGDDVILYPHVVLYDSTSLGNRVIVHAHAVLGADGFGYRFQEGRHVKVPQFGSVEIGDDVEIGAGTTIDRGTFQPTRVGSGTKIDNLVMVAHNCQVGRHALLVSQVGIAGSCTIGDYTVLAGQAGVADHVNIGAQAVIGARSGVFRDVPAGERMLGAPARPEGETKRIYLSMAQLPSLCRDVRKLRQQLAQPERNSGNSTQGTSDNDTDAPKVA